MDEALVRKIVREELEKLLQEKEEKNKISGEFRVCYADGGGWKIDKFTLKEEDALFHKRYLEAQGKQAKITVWSYLQECGWDYDELKKQMEEQK